MRIFVEDFYFIGLTKILYQNLLRNLGVRSQPHIIISRFFVVNSSVFVLYNHFVHRLPWSITLSGRKSIACGSV